MLATVEIKALGLEERAQKRDVRGRFGARVPVGIDLDKLGVPARFEDAVDLGDHRFPLGLG